VTATSTPTTKLRPYEQDGTFSERFPILYQQPARRQKAEKVLRVLTAFHGGSLQHLTAVDVGASTCLMTEVFAREIGTVIALDPDHLGLQHGRGRALCDNLRFVCGDGTQSPLRDESVDIVICNQVYEHVEDQPGLAHEIYRILKRDGFCYFGAGSRYVLIEGHYFLPFLSWLPNRWSSRYLRLVGRRLDYDVYLLSYFKLKQLLKAFVIHDFTARVLTQPETYAAEDLVKPGSLWTRLPPRLYEWAKPLLPGWAWVLTKPKAPE
jgi:SAM-dependent methyltransferase